MKKIMFNNKYGLTQAVLDGRKTMTRRIVPQSVIEKYSLMEDFTIIDDAKYNVGEVVAIAQPYKEIFDEKKVLYRSIPEIDGYKKELASEQRGWNHKMFVAANLMPHHIRITDVRVERLQDISDDDCIKEGIYKGQCGSISTHFMDAYYFKGNKQPYCTPREAYADLIDCICGKGAWESNPYVFVYEFELVD